MTIGERITQLRAAQNMSQNQLAKAMDVSRQAVSKWETGQSTPEPAKMILLCQVLNTDLEYLTTGKVSEPTPPPEVIEKVVETVVEVPVVEFVNQPVIKYKVRTKYVRNPLEYIGIGLACFLIGLMIGLLF